MRKYHYRQSLLLMACVVQVTIIVAAVGRACMQQAFAIRSQSQLSAPVESSTSRTFSCLPKNIRADEVVSYGPKGAPGPTVEKTLVQMKARCRNGKLIDSKRREIRFFRPSCWGNPPPDYLEIRQREDDELAKLKKRYPVIVFTCNPMIQ